MPALILDGKKVRDLKLIELKHKVEQFSHASDRLSTRSSLPILAIIQVGDRPDSTSYIKAKKTFAQKIGIKIEHIHLLDVDVGISKKVLQDEVISAIKNLNANKAVTGIIVQLPLPEGIDRDLVINTIDPRKDADGLTAYNVERRLERGIAAGTAAILSSNVVLPATARGVRELLAHYKIVLTGKKVVVIGRSALVGKPIADMCTKEGAQVTVCHSKTADLRTETQKADIIIVAVGKPRLITREHVKKGQVIIDVGISKSGEVDLTGKSVGVGKLVNASGRSSIVGDVDFEAVKKVVSAISPVPGGVGPMTVLALFENVVDLVIAKD